MDRWKADMGKIKKKKRRKKKKIKPPKKENLGIWRGRKITKYCIILIIYNLGGSKNRLIKLAGAEVAD